MYGKEKIDGWVRRRPRTPISETGTVTRLNLEERMDPNAKIGTNDVERSQKIVRLPAGRMRKGGAPNDASCETPFPFEITDGGAKAIVDQRYPNNLIEFIIERFPVLDRYVPGALRLVPLEMLKT